MSFKQSRDGAGNPVPGRYENAFWVADPTKPSGRRLIHRRYRVGSGDGEYGTKDAARLAANADEIALKRGADPDDNTDRNPTLAQFLPAYLRDSQASNEASTYTSDCRHAQDLKEILGAKRISQITRLDVEDFRHRLRSGSKTRPPLGNATINRKLACLRHVFNLAIMWSKGSRPGWDGDPTLWLRVTDNPVEGIEHWPEKDFNPRLLRPEEDPIILDHLCAAIGKTWPPAPGEKWLPSASVHCSRPAPEVRSVVRARAHDRCHHCGERVRWNDRRTPRGACYHELAPGEVTTVANLVVSCRGCRARLEAERPARILNPRTFARLKIAASLPSYYVVMRDTGMRKGGVARILPEWLYLEERGLRVPPTKGPRVHWIGLTQDAVRAFECLPMRAGQPLFPAGCYEGLRRAFRDLRLEGLTPHGLRHTWTTDSLESGKPESLTEDEGGWSGPKMIRRYSHPSLEWKRAAADRLSEHRAERRAAKSGPTTPQPGIQIGIQNRPSGAISGHRGALSRGRGGSR